MVFNGEMSNWRDFSKDAVARLIDEYPDRTLTRREIDHKIIEAYKEVGGGGCHKRGVTNALSEAVQEGLMGKPSLGFYYIPPKTEADEDMTDHAPLPVAGYTTQPDDKVLTVNENKQLEETVLKRLDVLAADPDIDPRWLAIGRTHIEQGFMSINRAVFKPQRLP